MEARSIEELGENPEQIEARCRADYARGYGRVKEAKKKSKNTKRKESQRTKSQ
jgi:hypothetical protein